MIKPLGVHVLVAVNDKPSAFQMPELSKESAEKGEVIGIGADVNIYIKENDIVIFKRYSPEEFVMDGKTVYLVEEQDIMGIEV